MTSLYFYNKRSITSQSITNALTTRTFLRVHRVVAALSDKMGYEKVILKPGQGPCPEYGRSVTVHCTGYGKNGDLNQKFWSTKDPGQQPFTFTIGHGEVIKGWDEGVKTMRLGEIARITCSPDYAYGSSGFPAWGILPNSELVFEIEMLQM